MCSIYIYKDQSYFRGAVFCRLSVVFVSAFCRPVCVSHIVLLPWFCKLAAKSLYSHCKLTAKSLQKTQIAWVDKNIYVNNYIYIKQFFQSAPYRDRQLTQTPSCSSDEPRKKILLHSLPESDFLHTGDSIDRLTLLIHRLCYIQWTLAECRGLPPVSFHKSAQR